MTRQCREGNRLDWSNCRTYTSALAILVSLLFLSACGTPALGGSFSSATGSSSSPSGSLAPGRSHTPKPKQHPTRHASVPAVTLAPKSLTFSNQETGTTSTAQPVTLTNSGTAALTITSVTSPGGDFAQTNDCPLAPSGLAVGYSCTIRVSFSPTATGTRTGAIAIADDASGSPQTVALSGTGVTPPPSVPVVSLAPKSLTFSNQETGTTSAAQPVTLTNSGTAALTITSVTSPGGDFAQTNDCPLAPSDLAVGYSCTIRVSFSPTATGTRAGTIAIADDASGSPQTVALSGTGVTPPPSVPVVSLAPKSLTFSNQETGTTSAAQSVMLTNSGTAVLTITSVISTSGDFAQTNDCPLAPSGLAVGYSCTIRVSFSPRATGTRAGTIAIADDASGSPQTVALSGAGVTPPPSVPVVSLAPKSLTFSNQETGTTSAAQSVTLTNSGTAALTITSVTSPGGDFAQTNDCPLAPSGLAVGYSCTIRVSFSPTATGTRTGAIAIADDASGSPQTVVLSGTGVTPPPPPGNGTEVPMSFFGMHIKYLPDWPSVPFGAVGKTQAVNWEWVERSRGVYDWHHLDERLAAAQQHGLSFFYSNDAVPVWAAKDTSQCVPAAPGSTVLKCKSMVTDIQDWDDFITALATRYKGRLNYELWNEPSANPSLTVADMVTLTTHEYNIIRSIDPGATIVCCAFTPYNSFSYMDRFFAAGGLRGADVISFHGIFGLPVQPPEWIVTEIDSARQVLAKYGLASSPLWDTEGGWSVASPPTPSDQPAFVAKWFLLQWSKGVSRVYWYGWDFYRTLFDPTTGSLIEPGVGYQQVQNWMAGAVIEPCTVAADFTWSCSVTRANGYQAQVVWTSSSTSTMSSYSLAGAQYTQYRDLSGKTVPVSGKSAVAIGTTPILLENFTP